MVSAQTVDSKVTQLYHNFREDRDAIARTYSFPDSQKRITRFERFYSDQISKIHKLAEEDLSVASSADLFLLKNEIEQAQYQLGLQKTELIYKLQFLPFLPTLEEIHDQRIGRGLIPDGEMSGGMLDHLEKEIRSQHKKLQNSVSSNGRDLPSDSEARKLRFSLRNSIEVVEDWHKHFSGYDPLFTWWTKKPYEGVIDALNDYSGLIDQAFIKDESEGGEIPGDPIGREELLKSLEFEMIPYSPEELIELAKEEMKWVEAEMLKASKELGFDTWQEGMEYVKSLHEPPGKQPTMVRNLADQAIEYLEENDLITIPELAKETWRMSMMSPARQKVSPFFLGGESIIVSFPTDTMSHEEKLMSMKSNNHPFSMATVHHELIPGHHLQFFMNSRNNTHRSGVLGTPFWVEGWALYWEFLLFKRDFPSKPEEKIGFLFWRKHRCARIIFSLSFHLGKMSTTECVNMLVDVVGHERSTAEGEVRRSFNGSYAPLYQAAYMLGAFQMWQMRREFVDSGKMTEKEFHDKVLLLGNIPWAIGREILNEKKVPLNFKSDWKFYNGNTQ